MSQPLGMNNYGPERPWLDDDLMTAEDHAAGPAANLVSLGFIRAALRRTVWLWCIAAVAGLVIGSGLYVRAAHNYHASTTLLLTVGPEPQPGTAILEDQAVAQSNAVAGLAMRKLGLHQSVDTFLRSYTVTVLTDRILQVTANAPSSSEAVRHASALATAFLVFRADQLRAEQRLEFAALDQQINQDKQNVTTIARQISQVSAEPRSSSKLAKLGELHAQASRASSDLTALTQAVSASKASTEVTTATMIGGSKVLDAASPVPPTSRVKHVLLYVGGGFLLGLLLAMGIVVVLSLLTERLRRRDDVAGALGASVRSVPAVRTRRWLPSRGMRDSGYHAQRIVDYLRVALPAGPGGTVALAVVPVDGPWVAARAVVSLAEDCARDGARVVVADLSPGAPAAALLGADGPGIRTVSVDGARIVAAVPDPADFAPVGPLKPAAPRVQSAAESDLAAACASADVLLTLIPLDPSVGGEHLSSWAADAVVMVTAGQSSWTKIHAVGEMIRLAGTRLVFAVLVGADKTDESLGVTPARADGWPAASASTTHAEPAQSVAGTALGRRPEDGTMSMTQLDPREHVGQRAGGGD